MHTTVLLHETIDGLALAEGDVVFDLTLGDGGHAAAACRAVGASGTVVGIDADEAAIRRATQKLSAEPCRFLSARENFRNIDEVARQHKVGAINKIIMDLGLRTGHLEESGRGFSFKKDEPLLMTFDSAPGEGVLTAYEVVNTWSEQDLTDIIREYGEERFARPIAQAIVAERGKKRVGTTAHLAEIVESAVPAWYRRARLHPATKTFQAIRMAVNDELPALQEALEKGVALLAREGRIAVISFHSLEDRVVKNFFRTQEKEGGYRQITKKPIVPSRGEVARNPRSRSAKLRILEKEK